MSASGVAVDPLNILHLRGTYAFGEYRLDSERHRLYRDTDLLSEDERTVEFLWLLIRSYPNTVRKEELLAALWPTVVVTDWSLSRLVSDTRQLLNDNGEQQRIIRTVRGSGFKFLIEPMRVMEAQQAAANSNPSNGASQDAVVPQSAGLTRRKFIWIAGIVLSLVFALAWVWVQQHSALTVQQSMQRLYRFQEMSFTAFKAQVTRRDELTAMIETRLDVKRNEEYEKFFAKYFAQMTADEHFAFDQIRAITLGHLSEANQGMLDELERTPELTDAVPELNALRDHLVFWLQKYRTVFLNRSDMCVLYAGVEDGVPYPTKADQAVKAWLATH